MDIAKVFEWLQDAAIGGLDTLVAIANDASALFFSTGGESGPTLTTIGVLTIAGVGGPLAFKFIKYIISLFKKVKIN